MLSDDKIGNIIKFHTRPWWGAPKKQLEEHIAEAAHAIAEAHEAEVAGLEARLAVMAEALRELSEHGLCGIDEIRWEAYAQADKALAAAPKVLWSEDCEYGRAMRDLGLPPIAGVSLWDKVQVIVLDPSEQGQDSEREEPCESA